MTLARWMQQAACFLLATSMLAGTAPFVAPVSAAPPPLPTDAFGREVIGILWVDAVKLDAAKLQASVKTMFGTHAGVVNEWFGQYERAHASFVRAGGTSMAILYYDDSLGRDSANPIFLFSKSPNANEATIKGVLRGISNDIAFEALGDWIVAYRKNQALPFFDRGSKLRVQAFQSALRPIATHPMVVAFVPNRTLYRTNERDAEEIKSAHTYRTNLARNQLAAAKDDATRQRINRQSAIESIAHEAVSKLNIIERIMLEGTALSFSVTLGDKPIVEAELMLADRTATADFMKIKTEAAPAMTKALQQKTLRGVPVRMINRLAAQQAVLSYATIEPSGPTILARASGENLAKMIASIASGASRSLDEARVVRSMSQMKILALGLNSFARDNGGVFPDNFEPLEKIAYVRNLKELLINPRGPEYGYTYLRPRSKFQDMAKANKLASTPLLMETKNGRVDPTGLVVYVSGKVFRPSE